MESRLTILNSSKKSKENIHSLDYFHEIENYKTELNENGRTIKKLEAEVLDNREMHKNEIKKLLDDLNKQKEKYDRLHESHKRVSRLNHELEEKVLIIIEKSNTDKEISEKQYNDLLSRYNLVENHLQEVEIEAERYKTDCLVAVQLLQNNPSSFLSRNINTLPINIKERLKEVNCDNNIDSHSNSSNQTNFSNSFLPISTFPPTTAMFAADLQRNYSTGDLQNHNNSQIDAKMLAQILHPDRPIHKSERGSSIPTDHTNSNNSGTSRNDLQIQRIVYENNCHNCGSVREYCDKSTQTLTNKFITIRETNSVVTQRNQKNKNENIVFEV